MWGFVQEITIVQWALLVVGLFLVYPLILKAVKQLDFFNPKPSPRPQPVPAPDFIDPDAILVSAVEAWSYLRSVCKKAGLKEAETKLLEVFPLLIKEQKTG